MSVQGRKMNSVGSDSDSKCMCVTSCPVPCVQGCVAFDLATGITELSCCFI